MRGGSILVHTSLGPSNGTLWAPIWRPRVVETGEGIESEGREKVEKEER